MDFPGAEEARSGSAAGSGEAAPRAPARCSRCASRQSCLPLALPDEPRCRLERLVRLQRRVKSGESLYRHRAESGSLYAISAGSFKTTLAGSDGEEQIAGFFIAGDMLGLDALWTRRHMSRAVALEDSLVCVLPYPALRELGRELPELAESLHGVLSQEIVRSYSAMLMLGKMPAGERVASFLLDLSRRYAARGYSAHELRLSMSRRELGAYLGLRVETVSRRLGRLHKLGAIEVDDKRVRILNMKRLGELASHDLY